MDPYPSIEFTPLNRRYDEKFGFEFVYNEKTIMITPSSGINLFCEIILK
jgi:hypothetical protein